MNDKKLNFYLFSSSYRLAQKLYNIGKLRAVYFEQRHINQDIVDFCGLWKIPYIGVKKISDLNNSLKEIDGNSLGISYGFGLIFKDEHIKLFEHGIWNIHPGKLPANRGRHPVGWSFVNNDTKFTLSIHSINERIDQGALIYEEEIIRDLHDDTRVITAKIESCLEKDFIEKAIKNYNDNKLIPLAEGNYNKNLIGKFDHIKSCEYTSCELFSIFKSQLIYGSLNVDGCFFNKCNFYNELIEYSNSKIISAKDGIKLVLSFA